jgi:hypothetical protein
MLKYSQAMSHVNVALTTDVVSGLTLMMECKRCQKFRS